MAHLINILDISKYQVELVALMCLVIFSYPVVKLTSPPGFILDTNL